MGIGSWWKRVRRREDEAALAGEEKREHRTREERRVTRGDFTAVKTDERAARLVHEANIKDVERLAEGDGA